MKTFLVALSLLLSSGAFAQSGRRAFQYVKTDTLDVNTITGSGTSVDTLAVDYLKGKSGTTIDFLNNNLSNIGTYSGSGDDNIITISTSNATSARTLINWKRQSSNMWDWNLLSSATNDLGLYSYGVAGYVITVARSTGATTFASTVSAVGNANESFISTPATDTQGGFRIERTGGTYPVTQLMVAEDNSTDLVLYNSVVALRLAKSTGAATFTSTVTTGDNILVPNTAGIFTPSYESGMALRTAGNVEIYNGSAVKLSITTTGDATFASDVGVTGNLTVTARSHAFLDITDDDSTEVYTLATQNVFYTATNWRMSISTNATLADSQVTITKAGKYLVNYSCSFNANASRTFDSYIFVDDVEEKRIGFERTMGTSAAIGSASATGIITLTANQVVKVKWRQTTAAASSAVTIQHAQLVLTPIFQ